MYNVNTLLRTTLLVLCRPMTLSCYRNAWQPSTTAVHVACSRLAQPIPTVPSTSSCHKRLLHQGRDQHWAWNRMQGFDTCPSSWFRKRFPLARLNIVTVVVSHTETVPPFQILRCLQCFRESICCVRPSRFHEHSQLSLLTFRLKHQESRFNVLERTAPLPLDDGGWCRWIDSQSELDQHSQEFQETLEVRCLCRRRHRSVVFAFSARWRSTARTLREPSQCCWPYLGHSTRGAHSIDWISTPVCICVCIEMFRIFALPYNDAELLCAQEILAKSSQSSEVCVSGRCERLANLMDCKGDVWAVLQEMSENAHASVVS